MSIILISKASALDTPGCSFLMMDGNNSQSPSSRNEKHGLFMNWS